MLRDDDYFSLFWKEVLNESKQLDIDEPVLGRKRKATDEYKMVIAPLYLFIYLFIYLNLVLSACVWLLLL